MGVHFMAKKRSFKKKMFMTGMALVATHLANQAIFLSAEKNSIPSTKSIYKWKYGDISYTVTGKGSPILLVHDLSVESSLNEWSEIVSRLANSHTVYALDLLGCGNSEKPNMTYTTYLYITLINDFISDIIGAKSDVVTSGFSFSIVTMAANINSALFNKLIFINPCTIDEATKQQNDLNQLYKAVLTTPIIGTLLYNIAFSRNNLKYEYTTNKLTYTNAKLSAYINDCYSNAHIGGSSVKTLNASYKNNYFYSNYDNGLSNLESNVLLLIGSDLINSEGLISKYLYKNSNFEYKKIGRTKQLPHLERPIDTSSEILLFLERATN